MSAQKFKVGDSVRINKKFQDRYNSIKTIGTVIYVESVYDFPDHNNRKAYIVQFPDKAFEKLFYSYELDKIIDE